MFWRFLGGASFELLREGSSRKDGEKAEKLLAECRREKYKREFVGTENDVEEKNNRTIGSCEKAGLKVARLSLFAALDRELRKVESRR